MTFHDQMLSAYIECALWTDEEECRGESEVSKPSHDQASKDCARFLFRFPQAVNYEASQLGHDLWLTRNHHGAGFWDRPEIYGKGNARLFTEYAHNLGERYCYLGDDGLVWIE